MGLLPSTDEMVAGAERVLLEKRMARKGDLVVVIASSPVGTSARGASGGTNFMKVHRVGEG